MVASLAQVQTISFSRDSSVFTSVSQEPLIDIVCLTVGNPVHRTFSSWTLRAFYGTTAFFLISLRNSPPSLNMGPKIPSPGRS